MSAYYNEIDTFAAEWLRELIREKLIAEGDVDGRSIEDVTPADLVGYRQCHFFAGISGWSLALRLAGWPDDREVWTGSCPCQPFSAAGKGGGVADERHLWPAFQWLIAQRRPRVVFGEQVAAKAGRSWFDLVSTDMEGLGYACWAHDLCAAGVGAPHIRQRLFWVADANDTGSQGRRCAQLSECADECAAGPRGDAERLADSDGSRCREGWSGEARDGRDAPRLELAGLRATGWLEDSHRERREELGLQLLTGEPREAVSEAARRSEVGGMADDSGHGWRKERQISRWLAVGDREEGRSAGLSASGGDLWTSPTNVIWKNADWLFGRDGKWRPVEPGTQPLAHGVSARVGRLRGYGNAIVAPLAAEFIAAYREAIGEDLHGL